MYKYCSQSIYLLLPSFIQSSVKQKPPPSAVSVVL
nr:MAG TPA: hypothetical protein [Caudoviricetes sp.]